MGKKLLIAAGTAEYSNLPHLHLPDLDAVVGSVVDLFTGKLGYLRELKEISSNPTSDQLYKRLDKWLASEERDSSDWVVFYYTGHGELVGSDRLYLLTSDYESGLTSTAFSVEELGAMLIGKDASGENRKVKRCLLILDTCHSGAGALGLSRELGKLFAEGVNGGMFYVLAASFPQEEAMAGALAKALIESLGDDSLGGVQQRLIYFDQLIPAINRRLRTHRVVYSPVASPDEEPQFFPNPRYLQGVPPGATVEEIRKVATSGEVETFWGPVSRGVESELQPGWYFTGREHALSQLSRWLGDSTDSATRVVTGRPGSGKSAILARIVTFSDPQYRRRMPPTEQRKHEAFPVNSIDLAVHAKGKTLQEIVDQLATNLGVHADLGEVLTALKLLERPFRMVLDALDEAREPERIARGLLEPLRSFPKVKLLVGTRPEYADKLGPGTVTLRIDNAEYFDKGDLEKYVLARLLGQAGEDTPYKGQLELAGRISIAVAERAYPNFLIARLVAQDLLERPAALRSQDIANIEFPASVGKAFEQYLARFAEDEQRARDLLTPLAWAEGLGLPWGEIWPAVAAALSGRPYTEQDVHWILDRAGSFVVEALEQGRSVYRLYHQALADYLRHGLDPVETERRISNGLIGTVPLQADGSGRNWRLAHSYIRVHLAEHAAACGMIGALMEDPLYLLLADPDRLLGVTDRYSREIPRDLARVYQISTHHLKTRPLLEAASYLEMEARKSRLQAFADRVAQLSQHAAWDVPWANWRQSSTHWIFAESKGRVKALLISQRQGRKAVVCASTDGMFIWDLEQGDAVNLPLTGDTADNYMMSLAGEVQQGRSLIATGAYRSIRLWDLELGEAMGPPLKGHSDWVNALAIAQRHGRTVVISGGADQTIRVWDVEQGEAVGSPLVGHQGSVNALVIAKRQDRTVIISGSGDQTIRIWDLERGEPVGSPLMGHTGSVDALVIAQRQGRALIISGSKDETIRIWDLERGEPDGAALTGFISGVYALAVAERQGRIVFVSAAYAGIRIWDLERREQVGAALTGHLSGVDALAIAQRQGRSVIISGGYDRSIRVWDLHRDEAAGSAIAEHPTWVGALAIAKRQGRTILISGSIEGIRLWDPECGEAFETPDIGYQATVDALAVAESKGRTIIIAGSEHELSLWDLEAGRQVGASLLGHSSSVRALAIAMRQGRQVVISGSKDETIRIWDLERGEAVGVPLIGHTGEVNALAVAKRAGRTVLISGAADGIRIWDLELGQEVGAPLKSDGVNSLAIAKRAGRTVIIAGGASDLSIWDLERGKAEATHLTGLRCTVHAVAVTEWQGRSVIIAERDGTIHIWDTASMSLLQTISTGSLVYALAFAPPLLIIGSREGIMAVRLRQF